MDWGILFDQCHSGADCVGTNGSYALSVILDLVYTLLSWDIVKGILVFVVALPLVNLLIHYARRGVE